MRGAIFYYSNTGNTRLVCQAIVKNIKTTGLELVNIAKDKNTDLKLFDVIGFAFPTDFWGVPKIMEDYISGVPQQAGKPLFIVNTFGATSGRSLLTAADNAGSKGFTVIAGYSMHVPENYIPMTAGGMGMEKAPDAGELKKFMSFISGLDSMIAGIKDSKPVKAAVLKAGFPASLLKSAPRTKAKEDMGDKFTDEKLCNLCGICVKACPYSAITIEKFPVFDMSKCFGCWSCYNLCPEKAVYTKKYRGKGHYSRPSIELQKKFLG